MNCHVGFRLAGKSLACALLVALLAAGCSSSKSGNAGKDDPKEATCNTAAPTPPNTTIPMQKIGTSGPVTVTGKPLPEMSDKPKDPAIGCYAPIINGLSFTRTAVEVGGASKLPTMIIVAAHWCPHCNNELPLIRDWMKESPTAAGVRVVVISTSVQKNSPHYPPNLWMLSLSWTGEVMADSADQDASHALGVAGYPAFVLLDTDGKVVERFSGEQPIEKIETKAKALIASSGSPSTSVAN